MEEQAGTVSAARVSGPAAARDGAVFEQRLAGSNMMLVTNVKHASYLRLAVVEVISVTLRDCRSHQ